MAKKPKPRTKAPTRAKVPDKERPVGREANRNRTAKPKSGVLEPTIGVVEAFRGEGNVLVWASCLGTAVLLVVSGLGLITLDTFAPLVVGVSGVLFVAGSIAFFMAYAKAIGRSRYELIGVGGLYFLAGDVAPAHIRRVLMWSFGIQVAFVIGLIVAKPFSSMVFTSLAPVYPIGLAGLWAALYGKFPPRPAKLDS